MLLFFVVVLLVSQVVAEVTILKATQYIYDTSPKLRIRGSGFVVDEHNILIELSANGQPPLVVDKDFLLTKDNDGDGLILKLLGNRRWADLSSRVPPVALNLSSVKFKGSNKNLIPDPIIIAQVLNTPTVRESAQTIFQSASNELRINGTGFIGSKAVNFYFQPPLVKEVMYEDVTKYPLQKDQIVLRLRHGYTWREEEGPLRVIGVDTGGGPVKFGGDEGVVVGNVVENHELITVDSTVDQQLIFADGPNLVITGSGFSPIGNTLRFANGLLGGGLNFTTVSSSDSSISIRLVPGSFWRKDFENLPGTLTLLSVNAGQGFVAVGPTNSGKGRDIAMVFERPNVFSNHKSIFRTQSHEFHIKGTGFPEMSTTFKPMLKFSPPLTEGVDYAVRVVDRTDLEVTLLDGKAWAPPMGYPTSLSVVAINTRGDDAGWVKFDGEGVHVAQVVKDVGSEETGGVEVFPMAVKVYQSALQQKIDIIGKGFGKGVSFTFDPVLKAGHDYEVDSTSDNKVTLRLKPGKKWRADPGLLVVKSIKVDNKEFSIGDGIRVAVILADPVITSSKDTIHESQSKLVVISGFGFTNAADTKISIRPTSPGSYKILSVLNDSIRLQLKPGMDWLPSFMSLKSEDDSKRVYLQVVSIDTGAGLIEMEEPVTVGQIIKDREGVTCDDSCEFAFDGVCDDGSVPNDQYYYDHQGTYQDDDFGGFYGNENSMPDYQVSACVPGTDCTDCGGVDAIQDYTKPLEPDSEFVSCTNTCIYARDGVCDDSRGNKYCELGTDCQDCGPVGADNFTRVDDDQDDNDDDYWTFNDTDFLDQADGLEKNRHKVKVFKRQESGGT
eukprot:gene11022-12014_t